MTVELLPPPVVMPELIKRNQPVPDDWVLPGTGDAAVACREQHIFAAPGHEILRQSAREIDSPVEGALRRG